MSFNQLTAAFWLLCMSAHVAVAEVHRTDSVALTNANIRQWARRFAAAEAAKPSRPAGSRIECMELREIRDTYLCGFASRVQMNRALLRTSVFSEGQGYYRVGAVIPHSDPLIERSLEAIGGHNLRGEDLAGYQAAAAEKCARESAACATPLEREFFTQFVIPLQQARRPFMVLAIALKFERGESPMRIIGHEVLHAQYALDEPYRRTIDRFWSEQVPPNVQRAVGMHLKGIYDVKSEYVVRNEFQAYVLDPEANEGMLGPFVPGWQAKLLTYLREAGTLPLQLK